MKKLIYIISALFFTLQSGEILSQSFWAKQIGGLAADKGDGIKTDATGNVYTIGTFSMTCDFDPSAATFTMTSNGNLDVFITKFNSSGNFLWAKRIGGISADEVADFAFDASGNIYIVGNFMNTCDFDPGPGTFTMTAPIGSTSTSDVFVLKLDMNGNFIWAKQMGSQWWDTGTSIVIDAAGNVICAAYFSTTSGGPADYDPGPLTYTFTTGTGGGNTDIALVKLTSAGNFVWAKQIGGTSGDYGHELQLDNTGNIYMGGYFTGTTDFDPGAGVNNLVSMGFEDVYVLKLDNSGNFIWARNWGSNTVDYGKSIALDASGNVYSIGSFRAICDFDPGPSTYTLASVGGDDIFVSKLDASGNFLWARSMGGTSADQGNSIAIDASGNVFTTGVFRLSVDFNPGPSSYSLTTFGSADVFIHKMDASGNFMWAGQMGGSLDDIGNGITVDVAGIVYTTGSFNATSDFDPTAGMLNLTSAGQTDAFVQRMCQTTSQPGTINGPVSLCGNTANTYSISTVTGATSYSWSLPSGWTGTSITNSINTNVSGSGMIVVTALNSCGTSPAQTLSVTVYPSPTVTAVSNSSLICAGQSATLTAAGANLYVWSPSGSGATIVVSPTITTNYSVTGLDINGCQNTATVTQVVSACAGINSLTADEGIKLYPNPTNGNITIELTDKQIQGHLEIYNVMGQILFKTEFNETKLKLDLSEQPSGIYFIILKNKNGSSSQRIIKD